MKLVMDKLTLGHTMSVDVNGLPDFHEDKVDTKTKEKSGSSWFDKLLFSKGSQSNSTTVLKDEEYIDRATLTMKEAISIVKSEGWKEHKKGILPGDVVQTKTIDKHGKIFLLTAVVDCKAEDLFNELHHNLEKISTWNPTILESKIIKPISKEVDITYQVTEGGGGGAVKPRELINLRWSGFHDDCYIISGVSVEYPGYTPTKYLRADNKVSCWLITSLKTEDGEEKCQFQWLMACDMKGWIPQYVVDVAMPTVLMDFLHYVRIFVKK